MKIIECFTCDLTKCEDCKYYLNRDRAYTKGMGLNRTNEAWNHFHPDDLMPQKGFIVHHDNKNRLDDSKENIKKWTDFEHRQFHSKGNQYCKGKQNALNSNHSEEANKKNSIAMKQYWDSLSDEERVEHCKKLSKALKGNQNALGYKHTEETKEKIRKSMMGKQNGLGNKGNTIKGINERQ